MLPVTETRSCGDRLKAEKAAQAAIMDEAVLLNDK